MSELQRRRVSEANTIHGLYLSPEYAAWKNMKARCFNPNNSAFKNYGGRGIWVCDRWLCFPLFFADMGARPSPNHSIERQNNDLGYFPENCIWATKGVQQRNTRSCWMITFRSQTRCATEWCRVLGLNPKSVNYRLRHGWDPVEAITVPLEKNKPKRKNKRTNGNEHTVTA